MCIEIEKNGEPTTTNENGTVAAARSKLDQLIDESKKKPIWEKPSPPPKIQQVPSILKAQITDSEKYYKPKWISIGPIHHGKQELRLAEDRYKYALAAKFVENSRYQSHVDLYKKIEEQIEALKKCFDEDVIKAFNKDRNDREAFGWMLFLDGCFILQFIYSYLHGELDNFKLKPDQIVFVLHDFFLLENQIPFQLLDLLMVNSRNKDFSRKLQQSIVNFIQGNAMTPQKFHKTLDNFKVETFSEPTHLLELLRMALLHGQSHTHVQSPQRNFNTVIKGNITGFLTRIACVLQKVKYKFRQGSAEPKQMIPVVGQKSPEKTDQNSDKKNEEERQQYFRSVMDLKAVGIYLKPSKDRSLKSVKFSSHIFTGDLELPPLIVDDSMAPKFLNLIAYEMCPDNTKTQYEVTSYISFLDSLIDYPHDVKELRSAQVLHNLLGSDKEVAKVFNQIGRYLVPNPLVYQEVIGQIEHHYKNRCFTWMAQFLNDHFSSPWTVAAFVAAILAIAMSVLQTWFAINPLPGPCDNFCQHL